MIDDDDRCEWMNVSSGTGSPGLSQTTSRQLKNGCVCLFKKSDKLYIISLLII